MSNFTNNPDYPTSVGSFSQHTWQGQQAVGQGFYYPGVGFGTMPADNSPRRADGYAQPQPAYGYGYAPMPGYPYPQQPVQPVVPQTPPPDGIGQMLTAPEKNVQPFSSYPPNNGQQGLNQMMTDARRADAYTAQAGGNNPWATQQPAPPVPMQAPVPPQPQYGYGYTQPVGWGGMATNDAPAMYGYQPGSNPFEKKQGMNMWDNMYAAPQPYVQQAPGQMQWTTAQVQTPPPTVYSFPNQQYGYPQAPPPPTQQDTYNWMEVSKKSWG